jgi:hypothetical protein
MGSEIVHSGEQVEPGPGERGLGAASGGGRDSAVPVFELGALDDQGVATDPHDNRTRSVSQLRSQLGRLRSDAAHRRLVVRLVLAGVALAVLSAAVADARQRHAVTGAASSRLAVDIRVDDLPQVEDPSPEVHIIRGDSSIDVKLHNLGPKPVQLTAILYEFGQPKTHTGTLVNTDVTVRSGQQMDRSFHVILPCGATPETAVPERPARLTARVRTTDGKTHTVPVDLGALEDQGGVFDSCSAYTHPLNLNADSQLLASAVQVSLDLPSVDQTGANTVLVAVSRAGVPAQVGFITSPRLPATVRAGTRFTVTIRPVVHSCPPAIDLTALPAIGLAFGDDNYADPYLPLLVAQAVGRACVSRGN